MPSPVLLYYSGCFTPPYTMYGRDGNARAPRANINVQAHHKHLGNSVTFADATLDWLARRWIRGETGLSVVPLPPSLALSSHSLLRCGRAIYLTAGCTIVGTSARPRHSTGAAARIVSFYTFVTPHPARPP
jgi:hypothetical protein